MWDAVYPYVAALLPTIGITFLCFVVVRHLIEADRRERRAQAQWEAAHRGGSDHSTRTADHPADGGAAASDDDFPG